MPVSHPYHFIAEGKAFDKVANSAASPFRRKKSLSDIIGLLCIFIHYDHWQNKLGYRKKG